MRRPTLRISVIALSALIVLSMGRAAQAAPLAAWELTSTSDFRNSSWSFGELFTVGNSNILVTALGAYDAGLNGFVSNGIPVGIYRESDDALLTSATLLGTDTLIGHYRYQNISPLILLANTTYRAVAVNESDLYNISGPPSTVNPLITWNGYGYCQATVLTSCDDFSGREITWMANFMIDGPGPTAVPEPASMLLLGTGLVGAGVRRYRRRRA